MKKNKLALLASLFAAVTVLTACGNGTSSDSSSGETSGSEYSSEEVSSSDETSESEYSSEEVSSSEETSASDDHESSASEEPEEPSSGTETSSYSITVNIDKNIGSYQITGTADEDGNYEAGAEISISVTVIDTSYTLSGIASSQATLTDLVISDASGCADFVMPESDVTIDVTFAEVPKYSVSVEYNNDTVLTPVITITGLDESDEAYAGTQISVSVDLNNDDYYISSITSEQVTFTASSIDGDTALLEFTLPECDVTISVVTEEVPLVSEYLVSVDCDSSIATYTATGLDEENYAPAGTLVTLEFTVVNGYYAISSITSDDVELSVDNKASSATVTFNVPEQNVGIEVSFEVSGNYYRISQLDNFDTEHFDELSISEGDAFEAGSEVTMTFTSTSSVILGHYINVNGVSYHPDSYTGSSKPYTYSFKFTIDQQDTEIMMTFYSSNSAESSSGTYSVTVRTYNGTSVNVGNDEHITFMNPVKDAMFVSQAYYPIFVRDEYVSLTSIIWEVESTGKTGTITSFTNLSDTSTRCKRAGSSISKSNFAGDLLITVSYTLVNAVSIDVTNEDKVTYTDSSTYFDARMPAGESASLRYTGIEGLYVSSTPTLTGLDESYITTNSEISTILGTFTLAFTVPESGEITITFTLSDAPKFTFVENSHLSQQLAVGSGNAIGTITSDPIVYGVPGRSYNVGAKVNDGYSLPTIKINGTEYSTTYNSTNKIYYYKFTCPEEDVVFEAVTESAYAASTSISSTYASVKFNNTTAGSVNCEAGSTVTFTITATSDYVLDVTSISLTDSDDAAVSYTLDDTSTYSLATGSFTMPESSVVLSADFYAIVPLTLTVSDSSSAVTGVQISGGYSGGLLSLTSLSGYFVEYETLTITVTYSSDATLTVYLVSTGGTETVLEDQGGVSSLFYASTTVSTSLAGIKITTGE